MDDALRVASAIAVVGVLLALVFLPSRLRDARAFQTPDAVELGGDSVPVGHAGTGTIEGGHGL
jgi:hypothetical protein